jgi:hypothetical protein
MSTIISQVLPFPTLLEVASLVQSLVNDDQGQVFTTDYTTSPAMSRLLNDSISEVYRELRNTGDPTLIADNYLMLNVSPLNGPYGLGVPAPQTQVNISYTGYFDGTSMWPNITLPPDMLMPLRMWERASGTNNVFHPMEQPAFGLRPGYQGPWLRDWEYRQGGIWMNGATEARDLRLRYQLKLPLFYGPNIDFETTYIPIEDSGSAIAAKTVYKYAQRLGSPQAADAKANAQEAMRQLKNAVTRRKQTITFNRRSYGDDGYGDGN